MIIIYLEKYSSSDIKVKVLEYNLIMFVIDDVIFCR